MVRHLVLWNFREEFSLQENAANALVVKRELEALAAMIPGIRSLEVVTEALSSSNRDVILISVFESAAALAAYQIHPEHVRVSEFVGTVLCNRTCIDFEI